MAYCMAITKAKASLDVKWCADVLCSEFQQSRQRKQMNRARSDRTLGSMDEITHKRLKTVDNTEQESGSEVSSALQ